MDLSVSHLARIRGSLQISAFPTAQTLVDQETMHAMHQIAQVFANVATQGFSTKDVEGSRSCRDPVQILHDPSVEGCLGQGGPDVERCLGRNAIVDAPSQPMCQLDPEIFAGVLMNDRRVGW